MTRVRGGGASRRGVARARAAIRGAARVVQRMGRVMRDRAIVAAVVLAAACGGAASAQPAPAPGAVAARAERGFVAWSEDAEGAARSVWLDASGREVAVREGERVIATADGALWRVRVARERVRLASCEQIEDGAGEEAARGERGRLARVWLEELGGRRRIALLEPAATEGVASIDQRIAIESSVGPVIVVRTELDVFACGAHGSVEVSVRTFDARTGDEIALAGEDADADAGLAPRARQELLSESEGAIEEPLELDEIQRVASFPAIDGGRVVMRHVLATDACFACSDGSWSSYTRAVTLESEAVPRSIAEHADWPAPVRAWLRAHPGARGVSSVDASVAEVALARFRGAP